MPRAVPTPRIPESLRADGTLRQVRTEDCSVARSEVQESPEESDDLVDVCHRAERALSQALRRSETDERPQDEPEVERCGMQVVPLHDVGLPTEMRAAHGSTLQGVSERALDELAALSHQRLALVSLESPPVLMGRQFRALLVRPAPFTTVRLADVTGALQPKRLPPSHRSSGNPCPRPIPFRHRPAAALHTPDPQGRPSTVRTLPASSPA